MYIKQAVKKALKKCKNKNQQFENNKQTIFDQLKKLFSILYVINNDTVWKPLKQNFKKRIKKKKKLAYF